MKKLDRLIMAMLLLPVFNSYSQPIASKEKKALHEVLESGIHDTLKAGPLFRYIKAVRPNNIDEAKAYTAILLDLVQRNNYRKGFGIYYLTVADNDVAEYDYDSSLKNAAKAAAIFEELKDWQDYLVATMRVCEMNSAHGRYDLVIQKATEALAKTKNQKFINQKCNIKVRLADAHVSLLKYNDAIKIYQEALEGFGATDYIPGMRLTCTEISRLYTKMGLYDQALEYCEKAFSLAKQHEVYFDNTKLIMLIDKGTILLNLKRYKQAVNTFKEALKVADKEEIKLFIQSNLALAEYHLGYIDKSIGLADQIIEKSGSYINSDLWYPETPVYCNYTLGLSNYSKNEMGKAKLFFDTTVSLLKDKNPKTHEDLGILATCKKYLAKIAIATNEPERSVSLLEEAANLESEKIKTQKDFDLNNLSSSVDLAQKNVEVKKLNEENIKNKEEIKKERIRAMLLIAALMLTIVLIVVIFKDYKRKARMSKQLEIRNNIVNRQKEELEKNLLEKNLLIKEVHHRVKNNFQMVISLLNLQVDSENVKDINAFLEEATSRILSMALIHQSLYEEENISKIDFHKFVNELISSMDSAFNSITHKLIFNIDIPH
jgi:two-component system, sensor histidine kinase PdtaS